MIFRIFLDYQLNMHIYGILTATSPLLYGHDWTIYNCAAVHLATNCVIQQLKQEKKRERISLRNEYTFFPFTLSWPSIWMSAVAPCQCDEMRSSIRLLLADVYEFYSAHFLFDAYISSGIKCIECVRVQSLLGCCFFFSVSQPFPSLSPSSVHLWLLIRASTPATGAHAHKLDLNVISRFNSLNNFLCTFLTCCFICLVTLVVRHPQKQAKVKNTLNTIRLPARFARLMAEEMLKWYRIVHLCIYSFYFVSGVQQTAQVKAI